MSRTSWGAPDRCSPSDTWAARLASPDTARHNRVGQGWWPQSLAVGGLGVALLHIERARADLGSWQPAHDWLACAAGDPVDIGTGAHPHHGAPALAFVLHTAVASAPGQPRQAGRYSRALDALDRHVETMVRRRLGRAHARIDRGELPELAEFDAIRGLAGLATHLLRRHPDGGLVRDVVEYLARLTEPLEHQGQLVPGWWTPSAPSGRRSGGFVRGHANNGLAHGIAGPLAVLALAVRTGVHVPGQRDAIRRIQAWLARWQHHEDPGWPYWITWDQLIAGDLPAAGSSRPSWCYGAAGLARAQQLAAVALGDDTARRAVEDVLVRALRTRAATVVDASLCHGHAGLLQIATRAAGDALDDKIAALIPDLSEALLREVNQHPAAGIGLLEGAAGLALALHTAEHGPPISGWDACLLIT